MNGLAVPVIAGIAVGISFILFLALATFTKPIPPSMNIVVNGTRYSAGIGSFYGTLIGGIHYSTELEPFQNLPDATINASRGWEVQFVSASISQPDIAESWLFEVELNNRVDLEKLSHTRFKIPEDAIQGEYILNAEAYWGENRAVSGASYHHKIRISSLERIPSVEEISDSELINRTMQLDEIKEIFAIHSSPRISVDRTEDFGVVYNISTSQLEGKPYDRSNVCLSIKIRLDSDGHPAFLLDYGGTRWELGDDRQLEFLESGGGCVFTLINAISDSAAIARTKELEEVKAFLAKYPSATIWTSRQAIIEVGYGISKSELTGIPWEYEGVPESSVSLRVQVDKDLEMIWLNLQCIVQKGTSGSADAYDITEDIVSYLEKEMHCWDDPLLKQPFDS